VQGATFNLDFTRFCKHISTSSSKLLEFQRAQLVYVTVPSNSIVETFNAIEYICLGFSPVTCFTASALNCAGYLAIIMISSAVQFRPQQASIEAGEPHSKMRLRSHHMENPSA